MGEKINKEFEKFQKELENREKKLRLKMTFDSDSDIDTALDELKQKEIVLTDERNRR